MKCQESQTCTAAQNPDWNPTCCARQELSSQVRAAHVTWARTFWRDPELLPSAWKWSDFCSAPHELRPGHPPLLLWLPSILPAGLCWHQMAQSTRELWVLLLFWMLWQQNLTTVEIFLRCRRCSSPVKYFWVLSSEQYSTFPGCLSEVLFLFIMQSLMLWKRKMAWTVLHCFVVMLWNF